MATFTASITPSFSDSRTLESRIAEAEAGKAGKNLKQGGGAAAGLHQLLTDSEIRKEVEELRAQIFTLGCKLDRRAQVVQLAPDVVERAVEDVAVDGLRQRKVADRVRQLDLTADARRRRAQCVEDLRR